MSTQMKAVVVPSLKAPWEVQDAKRPEAGPGEVLVRVRACGICGTDLWMAHGTLSYRPFPLILAASGNVRFFPLISIRRYWRQLFVLAVVAVLLTAAIVASVAMEMGVLPPYAAIALGAVVAPPDAAAATAILRTVALPRRSILLLKGESLLNDATALLLFTGAVAYGSAHASTAALTLRLSLAIPASLLVGFACAWDFRRLLPYVTGTLGGHLLEFLTTFGVWILAERLELSAVLCVVAFAMSVAPMARRSTTARARIHSFAAWDTAVFVLNVIAFLLMGLQSRDILRGMPGDQRGEAFAFAAAIVACVVFVRIAWLLLYNRMAFHIRLLRGSLAPAPLSHGVLIGWSGMRGLVTLAAVFALPPSFPRRDLIVLTAFAVVLATLVLQGLTLAPLARLLKLDGDDGLGEELTRARQDLAAAGLTYLADKTGKLAAHWREAFAATAAGEPGVHSPDHALRRALGLEVIRHQRRTLDALHGRERLGPDVLLLLQEELDFAEVALAGSGEDRVEEA